MFKLWSKVNKEAKEELSPNFGFRSWNKLSIEDKDLIWKYLDSHFFEKNKYSENFSFGGNSCNYKFSGNNDEKSCKLKRITYSVAFLNSENKARSYARNFLENKEFNSACQDFYEIFSSQSENVVLELLSYYSNLVIFERKDKKLEREINENDKEFNKRTTEWKWEEFDKFSEDLNEVFLQFGIKYCLSRNHFIPRQEEKIIKEIYDPVLIFLSDDSKWKEINKELSDAFDDYRKNTPQGYSGCITNSIVALEGFLQVLIYGEIGGSEGLTGLIKKSIDKKLIPYDGFANQIFKNINSILMRERGKTGNAHPKKEYSNEKNARMVLNLTMIFLQHCINET